MGSVPATTVETRHPGPEQCLLNAGAQYGEYQTEGAVRLQLCAAYLAEDDTVAGVYYYCTIKLSSAVLFY